MIASQRGQSFYWIPVLFGCGIGLYFFLSFEPHFMVSFVVLLLSLSIFILLSSHDVLKYLGRALLIFMLGFGCAQLRSALVYTPMLTKELGPVSFEGRITAIEQSKENYDAKLIFTDLRVEGLEVDKTPKYVRLRLRKDYGVRVGDRISALVQLMPPSEPLMPGGFDFRRYMYFKSLGAVGFIYKDVKILNAGAQNSWVSGVEFLRHFITQKIFAAIDQDNIAGIVSALMVGKRAGIADDDKEALRHAGLAHLLAISGLHLGLICGSVFFFSRLGFVCFERFALYHPIKKYAAALAIFFGLFYMIIAGATIPTQRAMVMSGIVFLAIILDRSPFSLRLVAFAGLLVLLIAPESLMSASFQLSFSAVTALIAVYEVLRGRFMDFNRNVGWVQKLALYFMGVCMTSVIAGVATAPFALYHFQQVASYGVLANFMAIPLMAFLIMPAALMAFIGMGIGFGLEYYPLWIMGIGVQAILDVSYWTESLSGSVIRSAAFSWKILALFVVGALIVLLARSWGRLASVFPIGLAAIWIVTIKTPDIFIAASHDLIALRQGDEVFLTSRQKERFVAKNWLWSWGLDPEVKGNIQSLYRHNEYCDDIGCRLEVKGAHVALPWNPYGYAQECEWADLLIVKEPLRQPCEAQVIDKLDTWRSGAYAIYVENTPDKGVNIKFSSTRPLLGLRPWSLER